MRDGIALVVQWPIRFPDLPGLPSEEEGVGTRARYYEEAGALRDMVQNHMLQLLCTIAMEPPWANNADVVRDYKLAVLKSLRPISGTYLA